MTQSSSDGPCQGFGDGDLQHAPVSAPHASNTEGRAREHAWAEGSRQLVTIARWAHPLKRNKRNKQVGQI